MNTANTSNTANTMNNTNTKLYSDNDYQGLASYVVKVLTYSGKTDYLHVLAEGEADAGLFAASSSNVRKVERAWLALAPELLEGDTRYVPTRFWYIRLPIRKVSPIISRDERMIGFNGYLYYVSVEGHFQELHFKTRRKALSQTLSYLVDDLIDWLHPRLG